MNFIAVLHLTVTAGSSITLNDLYPKMRVKLSIRRGTHRDSVNGHIFLNYFTCFSYLLSVFIKSLSLAPRINVQYTIPDIHILKYPMDVDSILHIVCKHENLGANDNDLIKTDGK